LRAHCAGGAAGLLAELLRDGFQSYQEHVGPGKVMQCIHSSAHVTAPWLHVHTFCDGGSIDGMPLSPPQGNPIAWCATMSSLDEAETLAGRAVAWAR